MKSYATFHFESWILTIKMKTIRLEIADLEQKVLPGWSVVAANGFLMPLNRPIPLQQLLCEIWQISPQYLEQRIQTLLLNSGPVDNSETVSVYPGDIITLSGAMPGLAGAILRRGGVLAGMRHGISARNEAPHETQSKWVTVKLFNLLINDLRSLFLKQGIMLPVNQGLVFLEKVATAIPVDVLRLYLDGQPAQWNAVWELVKTNKQVELIMVSI